MTGMSYEDGLLWAWIGSAAVSLTLVTVVLIWAIRSGQFRRQDHAARLPLESGIPDGRDGALAGAASASDSEGQHA